MSSRTRSDGHSTTESGKQLDPIAPQVTEAAADDVPIARSVCATALAERLAASYYAFEIVDPDRSPAAGAALLALDRVQWHDGDQSPPE